MDFIDSQRPCLQGLLLTLSHVPTILSSREGVKGLISLQITLALVPLNTKSPNLSMPLNTLALSLAIFDESL